MAQKIISFGYSGYIQAQNYFLTDGILAIKKGPEVIFNKVLSFSMIKSGLASKKGNCSQTEVRSNILRDSAFHRLRSG